MEIAKNDAELQIITPLDIEPGKTKNRGLTVPCNTNKESLAYRSRLQSRISYPHYTQSIYSEINRGQSMDDVFTDNISIPALDTLEEVNIVRQLKRPTKSEIHMLFTLKNSANSREPFEGFNWRQDLYNSFYFSSGDISDRKSMQNYGSNFAFIINENTQDLLSAEVFFEGKEGSEKLGNVSKYAEEDAEDIIVSDHSGNVIYKMAEDVKAGTDNISCIMLDLQGNKVSKADIDFVGNDLMGCRIKFPPNTNTKHKVLILTALVFKLMQIVVPEEWKPIERDAKKEVKMSFASCFFCFLGK